MKSIANVIPLGQNFSQSKKSKSTGKPVNKADSEIFTETQYCVPPKNIKINKQVNKKASKNKKGQKLSAL